MTNISATEIDAVMATALRKPKPKCGSAMAAIPVHGTNNRWIHTLMRSPIFKSPIKEGKLSALRSLLVLNHNLAPRGDAAGIDRHFALNLHLNRSARLEAHVGASRKHADG